jgi:hypothetical protein
MLNNKPQKAYRASLKAIYKSKTDTFIFKILAHV